MGVPRRRGAVLLPGYAHGRLGTRAAHKPRTTCSARCTATCRAGGAVADSVRRFSRYRNLPLHIPQTMRLEMAGMAEGQPDPVRRLLPLYHRIVFYHAARHHPELGALADAQLHRPTASGAATKNGHMLIGRNFDFEARRSLTTIRQCSSSSPKASWPSRRLPGRDGRGGHGAQRRHLCIGERLAQRR